MKVRAANSSARFAVADDETRSLIVMLGVSLLGHLALLGVLFAVPSSFDRSFRAGPRTIDVDLVSLPAPGPPQPAAKAPAPPPPPEPEPQAVKPEPVPVVEPPPPPPVKKEQISVAPPKKKPKVVKSLKKKTVSKKKQAAKVVRPTPPKPKEAKPQRAQKVNSAIDAMRQKVAGQEKARAAGGGGSGAGGGVMDRVRNYKVDVGLSIGQNFAFPQQLARSSQDLATLITFRVLPNGKIVEVKLYQSSGNKQLDEAAYRAVLKSSPVSPHPEGINKPYIEVGLRCTPAGVQ